MSVNELVGYYGKNSKLIGHCTREESELKNYTIANVIIFIFNSSGQVWLQKRSKNKKHYPGLFDTSACGAIAYGEKPAVAAQREQKEEMGFNCKLHFTRRFLNSFPDETNSLTRTRLSYIYVGISDDQPITNHEVEEFASFPYEEIYLESIKHPKKFVPSMSKELAIAIKKYNQLALAVGGDSSDY
ncbi:NUDIX domain-containing protein [Candidatus Saccharibacteria bacterium]|nr:NUDIX domain-containing protein [Candidatus Saccharibacteria bacterium]